MKGGDEDDDDDDDHFPLLTWSQIGRGPWLACALLQRLHEPKQASRGAEVRQAPPLYALLSTLPLVGEC